MADIFVTYDLEITNLDPHSAFLDQAEKQGWSRWKWGPSNRKWLRLPNTTLIGEFNNTAAAMAAFDRALAATAAEIGIDVNVKKYFLAAFWGAAYSSDDLAKRVP